MSKTERELILSLRKNDFIVTPFKSSGPGGQHRNKTSTAIRIVHPASGARAECSEHKSQSQNKKTAWERLRQDPTFTTWLRKAIAEASTTADQRRKVEQQIAIAVDHQMAPENILVEVQDENGAWASLPETCPVCNGTGLTYDTTEQRDVPCGGIECCVNGANDESSTEPSPSLS